MQTQVLQSSYTGGMIQDLPRHQLPSNAVWSMVDYIPDAGGSPLAKRGGWSKTTDQAISPAAGFISVGYGFITNAPGAKNALCAVDSAGNVWLINGAGGVKATIATANGKTATPDTNQKSRPTFFNGEMILYGTQTVITFNATTCNPTGSPIASYSVAYKQRLVVADGTKLYFSNPLDAYTWDVDSFIQPTLSNITGLAALPNMIAIFSPDRCERLRGSTPPSTLAAGDMAVEPAFEEGCPDARSIVVWNDQVIWANETGVHISDGASLVNLIKEGGLRQYWHTLFSGYDAATWTIAGGVHRGQYLVTVKTGSGSTTLICDLATRTWKVFSNFGAQMYAESEDSSSELYMALPTHVYIGKASTAFDLTGGVSDGDGTAVKPVVELPFFRIGTGSARWREIFVGVDLQTGGGDTGQLELSYTSQPDADAPYTTVVDDAGNPILISGSGTDGLRRVRVPVHAVANGLGLKIAQITGSSLETSLFDIEASFRDLEGRYS